MSCSLAPKQGATTTGHQPRRASGHRYPLRQERPVPDPLAPNQGTPNPQPATTDHQPRHASGRRCLSDQSHPLLSPPDAEGSLIPAPQGSDAFPGSFPQSHRNSPAGTTELTYSTATTRARAVSHPPTIRPASRHRLGPPPKKPAGHQKPRPTPVVHSPSGMQHYTGLESDQCECESASGTFRHAAARVGVERNPSHIPPSSSARETDRPH